MGRGGSLFSVCAWCRNQYNELCMTQCQREGKYRYLEPTPLPDWEAPPELPPFRKLVDLPAPERLAWIYLCAYYRQQSD